MYWTKFQFSFVKLTIWRMCSSSHRYMLSMFIVVRFLLLNRLNFFATPNHTWTSRWKHLVSKHSWFLFKHLLPTSSAVCQNTIFLDPCVNKNVPHGLQSFSITKLLLSKWSNFYFPIPWAMNWCFAITNDAVIIRNILEYFYFLSTFDIGRVHIIDPYTQHQPHFQNLANEPWRVSITTRGLSKQQLQCWRGC